MIKGPPKPITHNFRLAANIEVPAGLPDVAESHIHQYANKRWYTHLPTLHVSIALADRAAPHPVHA